MFTLPQYAAKTCVPSGGKNTKPELVVRQTLRAAGFGYRLHRRDLPGKPDIVLSKYRTVIFVNSCFWHRHSGYNKTVMPKSNTELWENKLNSNVERDQRNKSLLEASGWRYLVWWECEKDPGNIILQLCAIREKAHPDL